MRKLQLQPVPDLVMAEPSPIGRRLEVRAEVEDVNQHLRVSLDACCTSILEQRLPAYPFESSLSSGIDTKPRN